MSVSKGDTILLFDVDGTLTSPRQRMDQKMRDFVVKVHAVVSTAVVSGSDLPKIIEQLGENLDDVLTLFDYVFAENGLVSFSNGKMYPVQSIKQYIGEERLKEIINFTLREFSEIELPVKRGNFIEFRNGMLNLSPIGRSCTPEERQQFVNYDKEHGVLQKFSQKLANFTKNWELDICRGGQISVDVFPHGWDKTFCLRYLGDFSTVHFFGDKTEPGGNDHSLYIDRRITGHKVQNSDDTIKQVQKLLRIYS